MNSELKARLALLSQALFGGELADKLIYDKERAAFEHFANSIGMDTDRPEFGFYESVETRGAWLGWRAAKGLT